MLFASICIFYILYRDLPYKDLILTSDKIAYFYHIPKIAIKKDITSSGLVIFLPEKGDQCWDAPLPCTQYMNSDLRLRKEDELRYGFLIEPKEE